MHLAFSVWVYEPALVDEVNAWAKSIGCVGSFFLVAWVPVAAGLTTA